MTGNVNTTATNRKITELYSLNKAGRLVLRPEFQRNFVWNVKHQREFIDTILRDLPFPEIYIADGEINIEEISTQEIVVDGQQRLKTIFNYIEGELPIRKNDSIKPYSDLSRDEKAAFLGYVVTVRQLGQLDEATIKEVFRRINLTKYPLNAYEVQNAVYDGDFINVAKTISDSEDFRRIPTFTESDSTRMQDLGFVLLVMATVENGGYFNGDKEIENYVRKYNDDYPNKKTATSALNRAIKLINKLDYARDSTWYRKSNLFTLFTELASTDKVDIPKELSLRLLEFERHLDQYKDSGEDNDYTTYYSYMYTGTNSRQARVMRSVIFRKYIFDKE